MNTAVTRVIELDPEDFVWATWRKREVLKRPQPAAFDCEACRARLAKLKVNNYGWINWDAAEIAPILVSGIRGASGYAYQEKAVPLGEVDPVAVSEVLSDLSALAMRAK